MDDLTFKRNYISSVGGVLPAQDKVKIPQEKTAPSRFDSILEERIRLSGHALKRADTRGIALSPETLAQVGEAADRAGAKGLQNALILQNSNAFIVNVPTKTVVTVLSREEMTSHVFTNIDGAVIL